MITFVYQANPKVPFDRMTVRPKNKFGATGGSSDFARSGAQGGL